MTDTTLTSTLEILPIPVSLGFCARKPGLAYDLFFMDMRTGKDYFADFTFPVIIENQSSTVNIMEVQKIYRVQRKGARFRIKTLVKRGLRIAFLSRAALILKDSRPLRPSPPPETRAQTPYPYPLHRVPA